jgi:predicted NBD/HSP70 family sugar kinase/biotin operon repressor
MAIPAPSSQREMRQRNLSRVLHAVAEEGHLSRAAIAARIGLTRASVSTLVEELIRAGYLVELGPGRSGGVGRPGNALALTGLGPCGVGAEIGVDHLTACAVDLRGRVRVRRSEEAANGGQDPRTVLRRLNRLIEAVLTEAGAAGLRPAGLAVAVPGLVDRSTTTVVRAPNLGWYDTDIAAHLTARGLPLTLENEANFGALAELWRSLRPDAEGATAEANEADTGEDAARPAPPRDFIHVSAEVGIGAAIVLDGELLRGRRGYAGELGHVPVEPDGPHCACGGSGCLEQYAGEAALLHAAGIDAHGAGGRSAALASLRNRAEDGDAAALRALERAGWALGIALSAAVNMLDPRTVQLERRTAAPGPVPELAVSALGSEGPSLGAAHSVVRTVLDDPMPYAVPAR